MDSQVPSLSLWDKDLSLVGLRLDEQDIRGIGGHIKDNLPSERLPLASSDKALSVLFRAKLARYGADKELPARP